MASLGLLIKVLLLICSMFYLYVLLIFIMYSITYLSCSKQHFYLLQHPVLLSQLPPSSPLVLLFLLLQHLHPPALLLLIPLLLQNLVVQSAMMQSLLFSILILTWLKNHQQEVPLKPHTNAGHTSWRKERNLLNLKPPIQIH